MTARNISRSRVMQICRVSMKVSPRRSSFRFLRTILFYLPRKSCRTRGLTWTDTISLPRADNAHHDSAPSASEDCYQQHDDSRDRKPQNEFVNAQCPKQNGDNAGRDAVCFRRRIVDIRVV